MPFKVIDALSITPDGLIDMAEWLRNCNASTFPLFAGPELPLLPEKPTTPAEHRVQKVKAWSKPTISAYLGYILMLGHLACRGEPVLRSDHDEQDHCRKPQGVLKLS